MLWKLLKKHISLGQFVGFTLANLIGLFIVLLGVGLYRDLQAVYGSDDGLMSQNILIVNKKVSSLNTISGKSSAFTPSEIEDLASQSFVEDIGAFTPSNFSVTAQFNMPGMARFSTEMFFESVDSQFIDVKQRDWVWTPGSDQIPIILPRNYLDLYNFGFAQSKGTPQLSEGIISNIALQVLLQGNGLSETYDARIVGFSNRLNTILVPSNFLRWANQRYGSEQNTPPTRLIVQVDNPTDEQITQYLQDNSLTTDADKLSASKTNFVLKVITAITLAVGLLICLLSLYLLILSIALLLEKNIEKLQNLLLLGYSPRKVACPYQLLAIALTAVVTLLAIGAFLLARGHYLALFQNFFPELTPPSVWPVILVAGAIFLLTAFINATSIQRKVLKIWKNKQ